MREGQGGGRGKEGEEGSGGWVGQAGKGGEDGEGVEGKRNCIYLAYVKRYGATRGQNHFRAGCQFQFY